MTTISELTKVIQDYYNEQINIGKGKSFDDCNSPCIPIANIPTYLMAHGINWRTEFNYDKLPDLLQSLKGIEVLRRKPCYIYIDSTVATQDKYTTGEYAPQENFVSDSKSPIHEPKHYEIRNAYRKLSTKPEDWVSIKSIMMEVNWKGTPTQFTRKYSFLQFNPVGNLVRVHNISRYEIIDDIYFPEKNNYPSNVEKLRKMALDENWDDNEKRNRLLDNYLCYTYAHVKDENKIAISNDELHACWNTGLVDYRYEPIYCYLTRKDKNNRWMFKAFCIKGEDSGKEMGRNISIMPERAVYFNENNLLCQPTEEDLSVDRDHIIREHPSRLPSDWLKQVLGEQSNWLDNELPADYDKRISDLLPKESNSNLFLQTLLKQTIEESIKRCQWNYKTAIPYYDPSSKKIGWFLPLCTRVSESIDGIDTIRLVPFAALVVSKGISGRFQGETIYRLSWAYRCARLVCRPDSDWLTPLFTTDDKIDTEE